MDNKNKNPLHEDLVMQILLRLPVKSLVRFKCVSKSWLSLISDPNFAKSHFELFASHSNRLLYIPPSGSDAQSIDIETSLYDDSLNYSVTTSYIGFRIRGSCRGFILLEKDSNLIIWNPSTGFRKPITYTPFRFYYRWTEVLYGFGYDVTTDDYLIVTRWVDRHALQLESHWEFFSVRTNSWKEIEAPQFPYNEFGDKSGVLFNGAIHSVVEHCGRSAGVIVVFDLIRRNVSQILLPDCFNFPGSCCLTVLAGCLALCHSTRYFMLEIWVMKEYNVHSSWTRLFAVPDTSVFYHFNPMCSTKGGQIIAIKDRGLLVKVSDEGKLLESRTCFDSRYDCNKAIYTESLMSLPDDHGEARNDDQQ